MASRVEQGLGTGFAALDAALPGNGWPQAALTELLPERAGIGEWSLLLPALSMLSAEKGVVLIGAPYLPYAPALADTGIDLARLLIVPPCRLRDALACGELALRSGACGAVVLWESGLTETSAQGIAPLALRRLNLAADRGKTMAVLFRAPQQAAQPSPAPLRIALRAHAGSLNLRVFKRRGLFGETQLTLNPYPARLREELSCSPLPRPEPVSARPHAVPAARFLSSPKHSINTLAD